MVPAKGCYHLYGTNPGSNTQRNCSFIVTYIPSLKPFKKAERDMLETAGETKIDSHVTFCNGPLHIDVPVLANQQDSLVWSGFFV